MREWEKDGREKKRECKRRNESNQTEKENKKHVCVLMGDSIISNMRSSRL